MTDHSSTLFQTGDELRVFSIFFFISFLCHAVLFFVLCYTPNSFSSKRKLPSVINVDLATLSAINVTEPASPQAEIKKEAKKKEVAPVKKEKPVPEKKETVKTGKKKTPVKPKKSLKKKTYKSEKVLESARKEIKENLEEAKKQALNERLSALKNSVKKDARSRESRSPLGVPGASGGGSATGALIDTYRNIVAFQIQKNWNFSQQLAGEASNLLTAVVFKVMPDGKINDFWFDKRSGNVHLDESAKKAVLKSSPVQPHPPGISEPYVIVAIEFTPHGVQ